MSDITPTDGALLAFARQAGEKGITATQAEKLTLRHRALILADLKRLAKHGLAKQIGATRWSRWVAL